MESVGMEIGGQRADRDYCTADNSLGQGVLERTYDSVSELRAQLQEMAAEVGKAANRIHGPGPQRVGGPESEAAPKQAREPSQIEKINSQFRQAFEVSSQLRAELSRLVEGL